jgi:hypothetical protein
MMETRAKSGHIRSGLMLLHLHNMFMVEVKTLPTNDLRPSILPQTAPLDKSFQIEDPIVSDCYSSKLGATSS